MHLYRWDLDRTYLDTDIHSVRGMIRSAFESASEKRNIPGASILLRALIQHDKQAEVAILSGSPVQMRDVLERKLALDGIRFEKLILKDNLRNLRRGRFRAVRGQMGYKLPRLLEMRAEHRQPTTRESLFGDDAEVDAVIYALYAEAVLGLIDADRMVTVMRAGHAYDDQIERAVSALARVERADAVEGIYIHLDRGVPLAEFGRLGGRVTPVFSWFQAAMSLWHRGRLGPSGVASVADRVAREPGVGSRGLVGLAQDAVRRGIVPREAVAELVTAPGFEPIRTAVVRSCADLGARLVAAEPQPTDYEGFLSASRRIKPEDPS